MNAIRRKELAKALDSLYAAKAILEEIASEERDAFDNLPEGLQYSERGERIEEIADALEEADDDLLDLTTRLEECLE